MSPVGEITKKARSFRSKKWLCANWISCLEVRSINNFWDGSQWSNENGSTVLCVWLIRFELFLKVLKIQKRCVSQEKWKFVHWPTPKILKKRVAITELCKETIMNFLAIRISNTHYHIVIQIAWATWPHLSAGLHKRNPFCVQEEKTNETKSSGNEWKLGNEIKLKIFSGTEKTLMKWMTLQATFDVFTMSHQSSFIVEQ